LLGNVTTQSAFIRNNYRTVTLLTEPLTTDSLGTLIVYYTVVDGRTFTTSSSMRALCRMLKQVTLNDVALAELLSFGLVLRDESLLNEIRSIPVCTTLHPDGTITNGKGPRSSSLITNNKIAVQRLGAILSEVIKELEPRWNHHGVGFTGGKDSRILATIPKEDDRLWHWLSVSGRNDVESKSARLHADQLELYNYKWMEWTSAFLDASAHRRSADLGQGVGAVSDHTLLRSYFEEYCKSELNKESDDTEIALWIGTLADGLFARAFITNPANTIWNALQPRTAHLDSVLDMKCLNQFRNNGDYYHSNPFNFTPDREEEIGYFIRLLTRGRFHLCKSLSCFDDVCPSQINPYLHPEITEFTFKIDSRLFEKDAIRDGILAGLGSDLCSPSAYGYNVFAYSKSAFRALQVETRNCSLLSGRIKSELIKAISDGIFPALDAATSEYRIHSEAPQAASRSLRDYEHLLLYTTFLNLLKSDGVEVS
jgi:hypothetical protein